jgi:hypothetical protein
MILGKIIPLVDTKGCHGLIKKMNRVPHLPVKPVKTI